MRASAIPFRPTGGVQQEAVTPSRALCHFYSKGQCRNRDNCAFWHGGPAAPQAVVDSRSQIPCRFYLQGRCTNGDKCPFAHTAESAIEQQPPESQDEDKTNNWIRELCGALIQFGDGAKVDKVSFLSDFSAVRLSMLPLGSSPSTVAELLGKLGFLVAAGNVRVLPSGDASYCSADVRVEDPSFAKHLCAEIDSRRLDSQDDSPIKAVAISPTMPQGSNSQRVDCKKVHCSWHRSVRTVWLNFRDSTTARQVTEKFNNGTYKIFGQQVKSRESGGGRGRAPAFNNPRVSTTILTDVPWTATQEDILRGMPWRFKASHVELGKPSYIANPETANAMVKSKLMEVGSLEWWEDAAESGGKRAKAKARFLDEEDARKAAQLLDGMPLPFNKNGRLTVRVVHSARIKVSERIYGAVQDNIETVKHLWKSGHLLFIPYEPTRGYRVLKLEGEDNRGIAQAKNTLEGILAGETIMAGEKPLWSPSFGINGELYRKVKDLEQRLGVVIVRNKRQSRLQIYGRPEKCKEAQELLADMVTEDSSTGRVLFLDPEKFAWACRGGFRGISGALGTGKVAFDIILKRIIVTGSDAEYNLALRMVTDQGVPEKLSDRETSTEDDCAICWTEAENPVHTRCGHTYCKDCFETFCFAGATGNEEFSIRCEGDSGNCKAILTLDELQEHLASGTFEDILQASFTFHIRHHPQDFRNCPTPDCGQVYRTSSMATDFNCPKCVMPVCRACHVSHQGLTCAEHKDRMSGGYKALEKLKKELGIKDCPKCKTPIEKTYGCNHMECGGCRTHICWFCMRTFDSPGPCYAHMNKEHGNIGLGHIVFD